MNVFLIHAHHEPKSFSTALKDRAVATLTRLGHTVDVSDLSAMGFDPVSGRHNFTTVADAGFLKQQREEIYATDHAGFAAELLPEMEKLLAADLLIFNFPLWWFGMPATLKGWVDRVFAYRKMYGGGIYYENGFGRGKRALLTITTGSEAASFSGYGRNPAMATILTPIHHGIFWFNGFAPLPPFIAYAAAHISDNERARLLDEYDWYLSTLDHQQPVTLPPQSDFDEETGADRFGRWMVEIRDARNIDAPRLSQLEREGTLLTHWSSSEDESEDIAWFVLRAATRKHAETIAHTLGCGDTAHLVIRELATALALP